MLFLVSASLWLVVAVAGLTIYWLCWVFGRSDADDALQQLNLISDANLSDDDIDKAMWEAGRHDIAKSVDVPIYPKLKVREVRPPEQIKVEDQVNAVTALAMSHEELDEFTLKTNYSDSFDDFPAVNPATGLLMIGGIGGFDLNGNAYGFDNNDTLLSDNDLINDDSWHRSSFDD